MKKSIEFLLIIFMLTFSMTIINSITGETITGEASLQPTNVSIFIIAVAPTLSIISPENKTYLINESILLDYSSILEDYLWYNIDSGSNTTITSSRYINVTQGIHTLYLYANNSEGNTTRNVTFTANSSKFVISYNEYAGDNKGNSTDFNVSTYENLQNLRDIILEHIDFGKIVFNEVINVTNDENPSDGQIDLNVNVNISSNRIELNSIALPNFNKSATLYLYNLTFTNPRILKDGSVCSPTICMENSYSGNTLSFNVTGFSVYSAEETPASEPTPSSGGGGGGGGTTITFPNILELNKDRISISLKQGETKSEELIIKNIGKIKRKIILSSSGLGDFLRVSEESFDLGAGESKTIIIDFIVRENTFPDLYQGKLIVKTGSLEKEVLIAMEVESKNPLFDVKVEIPKKFIKLKPGEELLVNIQLFSLGKEGRVDVFLEYSIRDKEGNSIISAHETIAVETQVSFVKGFLIPEDIAEGDYVFYLKVIYEDKSASASDFFIVRKKQFNFPMIISLIISIVLLIIILFIVIGKRKDKKHWRN